MAYKKSNNTIRELRRENAELRRDNKRLRNLCDVKDSFFMELMSDGLRHGSPLAAKHMADRREYKRGK